MNEWMNDVGPTLYYLVPTDGEISQEIYVAPDI